MPDMTTPEHAADQAMGLELEAIDLEVQRKWAESQGRVDDEARIVDELGAVFDDLAEVSETLPADPAVIEAPRAGDIAGPPGR